jgi:hypothetical protein
MQLDKTKSIDGVRKSDGVNESNLLIQNVEQKLDLFNEKVPPTRLKGKTRQCFRDGGHEWMT